MKIACPVMLCFLAAPGSADCAAPGDLATGIKATLSDGQYEEYRDFRPGLVTMTGYYEDGYVVRNLLGQGIYVIELADLEDGKILPETQTTYAYPVDAADLPIPKPDARWTVKTGARDVDGFFAETQTHSWGAQTTATYGACSYDLIVGQFDYVGDGYDYSEEIHYLPELGIGLLAGYREADEDALESYTYVAIEKL